MGLFSSGKKGCLKVTQFTLSAGESEVVEIVIQESEAEGEAAKQFLEDVQLTFPQVLHAIKTKQVTHSTLMHLSEYVQNLEKIGLLEQEEMSQLHNAVQTDLKKLGKNPPLVEMPTVSEILDSHPLLRALPSTVRETLGNSAKMMMKLRGNVLYKEGSKPDGIWLIANGVVKCSSKHFADSHLLHPTFSCGSTLGLYEILTGKPCLCVLAAESAVHCFFIETTKVLSAIQMRTAMEDIFWQNNFHYYDQRTLALLQPKTNVTAVTIDQNGHIVTAITEQSVGVVTDKRLQLICQSFSIHLAGHNR
eukprot:Gb_13802 [translate_table: standard]